MVVKFRPCWICAVAILVGLVALDSLSLISSRLNEHQDSIQYLTSLVQFDQNLRAGRYSPEWGPDLGRGYGQPLFVFLPPGFYWVAGGFHWAGLTKTAAINATLLSAVLFSALGMFVWTGRWLGSGAALVAGAAYIYAPYFHVDLYVRGAYGEFMAFAVFPWVLWALDGLLLGAEGVLARLVAAVSFALVFLTHNPMALIFAPVVLLYAAALAFMLRVGWRRFLEALLFLGLGAGLSAFFWVPALWLKGEVSTGRLLHGYLAYYNHLIYLKQLFYSPWGYGILLAGPHDGMSQKFGELHWLGLVVCLAYVIGGRGLNYSLRNFRALPAELGWAAVLCMVTLYGLFFSTYYAKFIWDRLQTLQYLQFGMRFLAVATLGGSALVGMLAFWLRRRLTPKSGGLFAESGVSALFLAAILALNWGHAHPPRKHGYGEEAYSPERIARYGYTANNKNEFQPRRVWVEPAYSRQGAQVIEGEADLISSQRRPFQTLLEVVVHSSEARLQINRAYFPGWELLIDGQAADISYDNPYGAIRLRLPRGRHKVEARFTKSRERALMEKVSLGFLLLLLGATVSFGRRRFAGGD